MKLHEYSSPSIVGSNGSKHKFLASSKPSDRYVINVSDIGPQRKVEEFFTRVGVSFLCFGIAQDQTYHQTDFQKLSCFKNGLNMSAVRGRSMVSLNRLKKCPCLENYYGSQCSIPGCVYKVPKNSKITCQQIIITKKDSSLFISEILPFRLLTNARRVVMAIVVNHELEMTEIR